MCGLAQSKNERISITVVDLELEDILDSLSSQTGYFFSYNSDLLPKGSKYSISVEDLPIDQFLSQLLAGTYLKYTFFKEQIIINYEAPKQDVKKRKLFNISGVALDDDGNPLNGVNVFLDGTTIGTSTDIDGNYRIGKIAPGYYDLVFSYIGYKNAVYNISEYNGGSRIQNHQMQQDVNQLKEVEVVADRITRNSENWPDYFEIFKNDLFGTSENAEDCVIENPEVIDFTFDATSNKLTAFSSEPIRIRNEALAYSITYFLEEFERNGQDLRYRGRIKFQNDFTKSSEFSRREVKMERKRSFYGSWNHFRKSLLANRLRKDGFRLYKSKSLLEVGTMNTKKLRMLNEEDIIVFKGSHWEMEFEDYLVIVYTKERESVNFLLDESSLNAKISYQGRIIVSPVRNPGKQISVVKLLRGAVRLDLNGQVVDRFALTSFGYWSWERLANLVPLNYDPKVDNF